MLHWKKIVPIVLTFCLVLSLTTTANARTALTFGTMDAGTSTYAAGAALAADRKSVV